MKTDACTAASTFVSWTMATWGFAQTRFGVVEVLDRARPALLGWLFIASGAFGFASAFVSAYEGHLTTFSEGVLLRGATFGLTVWLVWTAWLMSRARANVGVGEAGGA